MDRVQLKTRGQILLWLTGKQMRINSTAVNWAQSSCFWHWYNCSDLSGIDPNLCHCNWDCSVCLNSVGCAFFQDGNYLQTITASFLTLRLAISEIFVGAVGQGVRRKGYKANFVPSATFVYFESFSVLLNYQCIIRGLEDSFPLILIQRMCSKITQKKRGKFRKFKMAMGDSVQARFIYGLSC